MLFGAGGNFFVQSVAYVGVLAMIFAMRVPPTPPQARESSAASNFKDGLAYVRAHPLVLALIATALIPNIFAMPYITLMPVFQKDVFQAGPETLGILMSAPGIGAVLTTLVLASTATKIRRKGLLLLGALAALGTFLILFAASPSLPLALFALAGIGGCQMLFMATTNTMLQMIIPDAMRGRVMSIYFLDHGLAPLGALFAGISAHFLGAPATVLLMGAAVIVLTAFVVWRLPQMRTAEI